MPALPTGTVTFLFSDIEGSTRLLRKLGRDGYERVQDEHAALVREAVTAGDGVEVRTEGDAFFVVFPTASGALRAAVAAQRALDAHPWPDGGTIRVRMGLHTGEGSPRGDDYVGLDVNRAARVAATGHGGQIVMTEATRVLLSQDLPDGATIRNLGGHRLKDLEDLEQLHDVVVDGLPSAFPPLRSIDTRRTNLPSRRTSFVGRDDSIAAIDDMLGATRLLTLTGPGGIGKTRLALEVAWRQLARFPDGVFFVDLTAVTDPWLVIATIAGVLRVRDTPGVDIADQLRDHLRARSLLLVLDNLEQVVEGSEGIGTLLDAAPGVTVLATSRIALRLSAEREVQVPPLKLPEEDRRYDAERLATSESVRLFADRAAAVRQGFRVTDANATAVAEIVARLDGLPLALELAASRLRVLDPAALAERLEQRLPLLRGGARDLPERHRTLEGAIAWSHDTLEPDARRLFAQLSVFAGGWTLDAAEAVCGDGADVIDGLSTLVDDSLVRRLEQADGSLRFTMLETIREYASERLASFDPEDRAALERRHAQWVRDLAEQAEPHLTAEHQMTWLETLEREQDNIRAMFDRAERTAAPALVACALRTAASIWRFWQQRGHLGEGRRRLERLLSLPAAQPRDAARARAMDALGSIAYWLADYETTRPCYEEAVAIAREVGDPRLLSRALYDRSYLSAVADQDVDATRSLLEESLATAEDSDLALRAQVWTAMGYLQMFLGKPENALEPIRRAIILNLESGERLSLSESLTSLAGVELLTGDIDAAIAHIDEASAVAVGSPSPVVVASAVLGHLVLADKTDRHREAAMWLGVRDKLAEDYELHFPEIALLFFGDPSVSSRAALGDEAFEEAHGEGAALSFERIVDLLAVSSDRS